MVKRTRRRCAGTERAGPPLGPHPPGEPLRAPGGALPAGVLRYTGEAGRSSGIWSKACHAPSSTVACTARGRAATGPCCCWPWPACSRSSAAPPPWWAGMGTAYAYVTRGLPNPSDLASRPLAQVTQIYDRTGQTLLYEFYEERRINIPLKDVSETMLKATLAAEDVNFYQHTGFDVQGVVRALVNNVRAGAITGGFVGGGSTITQQLVKRTFLTDEQSYVRKLREIVLAVQVERLYPKEQILELYLNQVYYGNQAYGVEAAALSYFGKHAKRPQPRRSLAAGGPGAAPQPLRPGAEPQGGAGPAERRAGRDGALRAGHPGGGGRRPGAGLQVHLPHVRDPDPLPPLRLLRQGAAAAAGQPRGAAQRPAGDHHPRPGDAGPGPGDRAPAGGQHQVAAGQQRLPGGDQPPARGRSWPWWGATTTTTRPSTAR